MRLIAGEHEKLSFMDVLRLIAEHQRQASLKHVNLLAPAVGVRLRRIDLTRLQAPFPLLDCAGRRRFGQKHGSAARDRAHQGNLVDPARVARIVGLNQIAEGHVEGLSDAVKRGQADILLAGFDRHQHPSADPGLFRQRSLAHVRRMAQASDILADVLQDGGSLS